VSHFLLFQQKKVTKEKPTPVPLESRLKIVGQGFNRATTGMGV